MVTLSWLSTTPAPLLPLLLLYAAVSALILGVVMYGLRKLVFPKEAFDHAHEVAAIYIEIHESEGDTTKLFDKLGLISDKYQYYKWKEVEQQGKKLLSAVSSVGVRKSRCFWQIHFKKSVSIIGFCRPFSGRQMRLVTLLNP